MLTKGSLWLHRFRSRDHATRVVACSRAVTRADCRSFPETSAATLRRDYLTLALLLVDTGNGLMGDLQLFISGNHQQLHSTVLVVELESL